MAIVELYNALAPCIGPVLADKYPQIGMAAGEVVIIAAALGRLVQAAKGTGKVGVVAGKLGSVINFLGLVKK